MLPKAFRVCTSASRLPMTTATARMVEVRRAIGEVAARLRHLGEGDQRVDLLGAVLRGLEEDECFPVVQCPRLVVGLAEQSVRQGHQVVRPGPRGPGRGGTYGGARWRRCVGA